MGRMTDARLWGLALLLLATSFAALAAAVSPEPQSIAAVSFGGLKLINLVVGTFFAGLSLWFVPQLTGKILGATISCGLGAAAIGTPLVMKYAHLDPEIENGVAALLGIVGVFLIPGLQKLGQQFRDDPRAFIFWARKGGDTPPGSGGGQP